jgi:hypothetical protein
MKKIIILLAAGLFLITTTASAQGIDDRAVIPVAVTLNSILRLNVVSGGNIEFNFNTLADYANGINNSEAYDTKFTVASSVDWEVYIYSEESDMVGTDDESGANTLTLDNIGYQVTYDGTGDAANFDIPAEASASPLTDAEELLVGKAALISNAGDINSNAFIINWRCGTKEGTMNGQSILEQNVAADRYATNVFLILSPL